MRNLRNLLVYNRTIVYKRKNIKRKQKQKSLPNHAIQIRRFAYPTTYLYTMHTTKVAITMTISCPANFQN